MKFQVILAGISAALLCTFAANSADASTSQCSGGTDGGTIEQNTLPDGNENCTPATPTYSPLVATVYNANNVGYTVEGMVENGNEILQPGEFIEVTIDLPDVMASLKANERQAMVLAVSLGVRAEDSSSKAGAVKASKSAISTGGKLTEAEYAVVANYVYASMQSGGSATGRSDPAGSFVTRVEAVSQAISRAFDSIGRNLPTINFNMGYKKYNANGTVKSEFSMGVSVKKS